MSQHGIHLRERKGEEMEMQMLTTRQNLIYFSVAKGMVDRNIKCYNS